MTSLLECYKVLGVSVGAGIADVTSSYRRLCRIYHPDVNSDPGSEELMKNINTAYAVLREKLRREAALRDRAAHARPPKRYPQHQDARAASEAEAYAALYSYFKAICACDYQGAYKFLSDYDKRHITKDEFVLWRKSVSQLFPMREFTIIGKQSEAALTFNDGRILLARKFKVTVSEEDYTESTVKSDEIEKLAVKENGIWKVFLGYRNVGELTRSFKQRFEAKQKSDIAKKWEEYYKEFYPEYNMLSIAGMRKAVKREIYRLNRFGGELTFAAISVSTSSPRSGGQEELQHFAASAIISALRETDTPAYAGDGVFAVLFAQLSKENAQEIILRITNSIRKKAGALLGARALIEFNYDSWEGKGSADIGALGSVLKKFDKKL